MNEFFSMGGFGLFVWSAITITLVFLLAEAFYLKRKRKTLMQRLKHIVAMNKRNKHENQA